MKKESKKINPFEVAKKQVDIAAQHLNLDSGLMEKLKTTKRKMIVHLSVKMDDGTVRIFRNSFGVRRRYWIGWLGSCSGVLWRFWRFFYRIGSPLEQ